ncbi:MULTISPECIES: DUF551 domain-containing protein [Enterobacter]|uniref:DUF551 domain-containing protein n=1 Tax=Enterobacter TaxID=547 RepID=UPI000AD6AE6E|nr:MULTISPECIES: DUF551 domain-containing protein [Enterobacter]MDU4613133.1 DUF551 domain-containing protein [Enterobacter sp.]
MSTITKERVAEFIKNPLNNGLTRGEQMELARIALASLEAEAVCYLTWHQGFRAPDDCEEYVVEAKPGDKSCDGSPAFPVYAAPPAPVSDEDKVLAEQARAVVHCLDMCGVPSGDYADNEQLQLWGRVIEYGRHPASVSVPDGYRLQPISEYDAMCAAMLQGADGNSPVIPDGWVACSERMPDDDDFVYIWPRPDFGVELHVGQYCECHPKGDGWYAQVYEQNYGIEWCPITVTHWMPLPAAPQQEVTQALAKGMERYGDAMQKLADSGD